MFCFAELVASRLLCPVSYPAQGSVAGLGAFVKTLNHNNWLSAVGSDYVGLDFVEFDYAKLTSPDHDFLCG